MQFMLMYHEPQDVFNQRNDPIVRPPYWGAWMAYISAMNQAGIVVSGNGLEPPSTTTNIKIREGKRQIHDGPYSDSKEHLGGYFIIEVDSLDEALEWAARSPCVHTGHAEVRPVLPPPK